MASIAELEAAFIKADEAGETEDARAFAQAIRAARSGVGGKSSGAAGGRALDSAIPATAGETAVDMARVIPGGLAKGVAGVAGAPVDLRNAAVDALQSGMEWIAPEAAARNQPFADRMKMMPVGPFTQTAEQINETISKPFGGYYKAQTEGGQYVERGAEFAPGMFAPGGIVRNAVRFVALPAVGSEYAGQATKGTPYEPYARFGGALAGASVPGVIRSLHGFGNRLVSAATSGAVEANPTAAATRVLHRAAQNSFGGRTGAQAALKAHEEAGVPATFIDVGGYGASRAVRASAGAPEGPAQDMARTYRDNTASELQDGVSDQVARLTPGEPRSATDYISDIRGQRQAQADIDYPPGDAARIRLTDTALGSMSGKAGRDAIAEAAAIAEARQDAVTTAELNRILEALMPENGGRFPPTISGRALEYVRQSMSEASRAAFRAERGGYAGGLRGRVGQLDTVLDDNFAEPRLNYHNYSNQIRAAELGQKSTLPSTRNYPADLGRISARTPDALASAGVGRRDAIQNVVDNSAEGATGTLSRLIGTRAQRAANVATFGAPQAEKFQGAVRLWIDRQRRAQRISPDTGSPTEGKFAERSLIGFVSGKLWEPLIDALRRGTQLTPKQRAEIVRLGTSEDDVRQLVNSIPDGMSTPQAIAVVTALAANDTRRYEIAR